MTPIRVLLADDHALVRAGFRALLDKLPGIKVVAEADDGREALKLIEMQRPDIAVIDITMAGMNGLETAARAAKDYPDVRILILSMHAGEEYIMRALRTGASGYMLKDAAEDELESAIHAVMRGKTYLSPTVAKRVGDYVQRTGGKVEAGDYTSPFERLTPRQREVLQLIAEGHTTHEIAEILSVSAKTIETHRAQLMDRLGIHDIPGLVRYSIRIGFIRPDE